MIAPLLAVLTLAACAPQPADEKKWELVWSDEFDGDGLDTNKWRAEEASIMNNQELQHYTPEAISVREGVLTIRAEKRAMNGRDYTSALIDTRGVFSMAFGKFECRAKLPRGQGMWPAIWMLPEDDRWPPEIDIMENLGQQPHRIHTTHHWGPGWPNNKKTTAHFDGPDYSQDFHTFGVEWSPDRIDWYIDGELKFSSTENIPQDPMYFIVNLAVGGNWGGNPDKTTVLPQTLELDWIRAYRRTDGGEHTLLVEARNGEALPEPRRWSYKAGERVRLRAEPNIGYVFKGWSGDASGTEASVELEASKDLRVVALFEPQADGPKLLSRGRPVRASSSEGWGMEPERAVDASLWTRWAAKGSSPLWIEVDLGQIRRIEAVRLAWTDAPKGWYAVDFSDDASAWRRVTPERAGKERRDKFVGLDTRARYVRVTITDTEPNVWCSLFSFEVYGR